MPNGSHRLSSVYWLDYSGQRVLYSTLVPGQSYVQPTFITHPWLVTNVNGACIGIFLPSRIPGGVTIR
jgi:von Hippel-Lindau disease tumor suppressor protein